jgi:hypothetical protein
MTECSYVTVEEFNAIMKQIAFPKLQMTDDGTYSFSEASREAIERATRYLEQRGV